MDLGYQDNGRIIDALQANIIVIKSLAELIKI
jgi:hypothetical protein